MAKDRLSVRISQLRLIKLRGVARERNVTMTQLIEDWIDTIPYFYNLDNPAPETRDSPN
jgi:hypothetical protein